jgi:hypothetical protein
MQSLAPLRFGADTYGVASHLFSLQGLLLWLPFVQALPNGQANIVCSPPVSGIHLLRKTSHWC